MDFSQLLMTGRNALSILVQSIIIIFCIWYIEFIYYSNILPDKVVSETYEQANCAIVNKQLTTRGKLVHHYRADFMVSYLVSAATYNTWVSGNGLDHSFTTNRDSQQDLLDQFDVGQTYPCWYNPTVPQQAVLVLRHNWASTFSLFVPSVVLLIAIYYFSRSIFVLFGAATLKTRETLEKRKAERSQ